MSQSEISYEILENSYYDIINKINKLKNDEKNELEKLDNLINHHIEINNGKKRKLDEDLENNQIEISNLEYEEKEYNNLILNGLDDKQLLEEIARIDENNNNYSKKIKELQKDKTELDNSKKDIYQNHQKDLFNLKVQLKSYLLSHTEKERYIKDNLIQTTEKYNLFTNKWNEYKILIENKKEDVKETIEILKENLSNRNFDKMVERRMVDRQTSKWIKDKRNNKLLIKKLTEETNKLKEEYTILFNKQNEWISNKNNELKNLIEKVKEIVNGLFQELKNLEDCILKKENEQKIIENNISNNSNNSNSNNSNGKIEYENDRWLIRQALGDLYARKNIINDKYHNSLIELNKLRDDLKKVLNNDPFKLEIQKINNHITRNNLMMKNVKEKELYAIKRNKTTTKEKKNKLLNTRLEINQCNQEIEKILFDYSIQEKRYLEEDD
jgi:hypothetical protein